jgi:hypothetical protein
MPTIGKWRLDLPRAPENTFHYQKLVDQKYFVRVRFHASLSRYLCRTNSTNETNFVHRDMTAPRSHLRAATAVPAIRITR